MIGAFQNIEGEQLKAEGMRTITFPVDRYGVPSYDELVLVANRDRLGSTPGTGAPCGGSSRASRRALRGRGRIRPTRST